MMEVILLEKVNNLGDLGDKVRVRAGFGRNYLVPQKKAVPATAENIEKFEARRAELEQAQAAAVGGARQRAEALEDVAITVVAKAGPEGRLFGSVGTADIAAALVEAGHVVEKREVRLPAGPLRQCGSYPIEIDLHPDVHVTVTVNVQAEDGGSVITAGDDDGEIQPTAEDD